MDPRLNLLVAVGGGLDEVGNGVDVFATSDGRLDSVVVALFGVDAGEDEVFLPNEKRLLGCFDCFD